MTKERKQLLHAVALIVALTAAAYLPAIQCGFTNWDDPDMVTHNEMIRSLSLANVARIFGSMHYGHYHPFVVLSYALEFRLVGLEPWLYHLTNVVLHILNSVLVFWFVRALRGGVVLPLVSALLFGVHPLHVESVAWITERKDVMYAFFYLCALICYVRYVKSTDRKFLALTALLFLCSLLSKAMAVTLPFVLFLIDYVLHRRFGKQAILEKLPLLALSCIFAAIVFYATYPDTAVGAQATLASGNVLIASHGVLFYVWKFVAPFNLSALYPYPGKLTDPLPIEYPLSLVAVIVFGIAILLTSRKTRMPVVYAGLFLLTVAPVLQLTKVGGVIAADRFVYIPLLGLILATVEGAGWILKKVNTGGFVVPAIASVAVACVVSGLTFLTWERTKVWKDSVSLWNDVISQYSGVAITYNNRGVALADLRDFKQALDDYNTGIALDTTDWRLYFNRGNSLRELRALPQAIADFDRSLSLLPTFSDSYYYRGLTYHTAGNLNLAVEDYSRALEFNPDAAAAYVNRGAIFAEFREHEKALDDLNRALALDPDAADVYFNRGAVLRNMGRVDEALADFTQSLAIEPRDPKTLNFRGMTFFGKGEFDLAIGDYEKALDIEPSNPNLYNNRGAAFYQKREFEKAIRDYSTALALSPDSFEGLTNRAFAYCASQKLDLARRDIARLRTLKAWIDPRLLELTGQK
jgi:tetratricopeptide (TPR) repeat protein